MAFSTKATITKGVTDIALKKLNLVLKKKLELKKELFSACENDFFS